MIRFLAILIILPFAAFAQAWPTLHDVVGVTVDDSLNVRAEATVSSSVIGQLTSDQKNVEVVALSSNGRWGRINVGEQSGWVSMRYLSEPQPRNTAQTPIACYGTEPFWSLDVDADGTATYEALADETIRFDKVKTDTSANNTTRISITGLDSRTKTNLTGFYRTQTCSDGMSNRAFGIATDFIVTRAGQPSQSFSGCCILSP